MKRKVALIFFAIVMVIMSVSCTMTQKCPVYANHDVAEEQNG